MKHVNERLCKTQRSQVPVNEIALQLGPSPFSVVSLLACCLKGILSAVKPDNSSNLHLKFVTRNSVRMPDSRMIPLEVGTSTDTFDVNANFSRTVLRGG